jgi:hypothetical protein
MIVLVSKAVLGGAKRFFEKDRKLALFTMVIAHVQLLIGFSLYFMRGWHDLIGEMGDAFIRFRALEHPLGMLIAIILITMGYGRVKRGENDAAKFKAVKVFFGLALVIILISIPWPFREGMEAYGWF